MDFEILFWIIVLLPPVLRRLFGKGKKKPNAPKRREVPRPETRAPREATPFEEALRQIQEALADRGEPQPAPEPPRQLSKVRPQKMSPTPALTPPQEKFVSLEAGESFDDKFEAASPYQELGLSEHYHEPLSAEVDLPEKRARPHRKKLSPWQQAVVTAEIIGTPRSRKPWKGPSHRDR